MTDRHSVITLTLYVISTYHPKSSGSDVNDISFNPNTVRLFNCENPTGNRGIGFELKSATWRLAKCLMSSGMSAISVKERRKNSKTIDSKSYVEVNFNWSQERMKTIWTIRMV